VHAAGNHFVSKRESQTHSNYNPVFYEKLSVLEANNFWFNSRNRLIIWALRRYFPDAKNFFEIGCGTGYVLSALRKKFPHYNLSGSDIYIAGLHYASARVKDAKLFQMDARKIPFTEEFDIIGAFDILEHIEEDERVLAEINKALKKSGMIILTVPQHPFLWSQFDEHACHVRRYTKRELVGKLRRTGFKIVRITSCVTFLLPLMAISRISGVRHKKNYRPLGELEIGHATNCILEKVMTIERYFIRLGLSFPVGGSLFAVAQKITSRHP